MITEKNIFEQGMLISIRARSYEGRRTLSKEQLKDLPTEIVRGVHDLFGKEFKALLKAADYAVWTARQKVKDVSIPFPIDGIYFLLADKIDSIVKFLEDKKKEREDIVDSIIDNYDQAIKSFAEEYPEYYQAGRSKYLSKDQLRNRFYFDYQFVKISSPTTEDGVISSKQYKKEIGKFKDMVQDMKDDVVATVYQVLTETAGRLKQQSDNEKVNQLTLNSLNSFIQKIDDVYADFIDRDDMKKVIGKMTKELLGVESKDLRSSEEARKQFAKSIKDIADDLKAIPDVPLKRSIIL